MKAVQMTAAGDISVLEYVDVAEPEINSSTGVKVQLKAAGINPIDTKIRAMAVYYPDELPAILGCDGAGVIVETGDAVSKFKVGDEVWFCHGGLGSEAGSYVEYKVLDEKELSLKPASLDFNHAAVVPLVVITAWEALYDRVQLDETKTILIHAGAGGVGHVAIQLAKKAGARVITTVNGEDKAGFVQQLGADEVIFYQQEDFVERAMQLTAGKGVDVVFDTVGPVVFQKSLDALAYCGHIVSLLDPGSGIDWKKARLNNVSMSLELMLTPMVKDLPEARAHQIEILDQAAKLIDENQLSILLAHTFTLAEAARAHELIETGHSMGKIALQIQD